MKYYKKKINRVRLVREVGDYQAAQISSSRNAAEYARKLYEEDGSITLFESFYMISLNNANSTTDYNKISQGGITGTVVDIRMIMKMVLDTFAVSIILVHNHPSGTLKPSQADKNITNKIKNALELIDVKVLDHIILTEKEYFSFGDENLI